MKHPLQAIAVAALVRPSRHAAAGAEPAQSAVAVETSPGQARPCR